MCQNARNCTDFFQIFPGACHQTPYQRLAPPLLPFIHYVLQNSHTNLNLKLVANALRIDWNYFCCVKVCQVHNDNAEIILIQ